MDEINESDIYKDMTTEEINTLSDLTYGLFNFGVRIANTYTPNIVKPWCAIFSDYLRK